MLLSLEFYERNHKATYYESNYELELQGNEGENIGTRQTLILGDGNRIVGCNPYHRLI
jgi:hypothetical protein